MTDDLRQPDIRWLVAPMLLLLSLIGLYLRIRHLGRLGFVVDEGFQALAVQGIIHHHGIPRLPSGEVYLRAPLFLYLEAACVYLLGMSEFAMRLPAVLFGIAVIPAGYFLGKQLFSRPVGLLVATLLALSAWEIELSRYARFYTAFQFVYILALIAFARGFIDHKPLARIAFFLAAAVAISLHQLGIMLATSFLVFVPYPGLTWTRRAAHLVGAAAVTFLWIVYLKVFQTVQHALAQPIDALQNAAAVPPHFVAATWIQRALARIPEFKPPPLRWFEQALHQHPLLLALAALLPLAASIYLVRHAVRRREYWPGLFALAIVWAAYTAQAALVLTLLIFYLALFIRQRQQLLAPVLLTALAAASLCLAGYVGWFLLSPTIPTRYGIAWMFRFPDLYTYFFRWFIVGWPVLSLLLIPAIIYLASRTADRDTRPGAWFVLGALWLALLATSMLQWRFSAARYFFHLYPLILLIIAVFLVAAARAAVHLLAARTAAVRTAVIALAFLGLCLGSSDLNPVKALRIADRQPATRKDPIRSVLNWKFYAWFHQDLRSAGRYVRQHLEPGEKVLVVGPPHDAAVYRYYVGQVNYILSRPDDYTAAGRLPDGRLFDLVAAARIIHTVKQLQAVVRANRRRGLWILSDRIMNDPKNWFLSGPARRYLARLTRHPGFIARDHQTLAIRIGPPKGIANRFHPATRIKSTTSTSTTVPTSIPASASTSASTSTAPNVPRAVTMRLNPNRPHQNTGNALSRAKP